MANSFSHELARKDDVCVCYVEWNWKVYWFETCNADTINYQGNDVVNDIVKTPYNTKDIYYLLLVTWSVNFKRECNLLLMANKVSILWNFPGL